MQPPTQANYNLSAALEDLIEKNASDFEVSKLFKSFINSYFSSLDSIFLQDFGREFLYQHTKKLDELISAMYRYLVRDCFGDYSPMLNAVPIAFVALGSYGREQLSVCSDIDIMLLFKKVKGYSIEPILERFLYLAWDAGLKLGHRVHEIGEVLDVSRSDTTIKTALIESRFICGSKFLWMEYQNALHKIRRDAPKEFIVAKQDEMQKRHTKHAFSMEPNLKEGVGGMRDANTLFWLASTIYGITSNKQLMGRLFSEAEYKEYHQAIEFIFKLRVALHLVAGKKQDALIMQYSRDVALKLGFKDTKTQTAERVLVSRVLRSMAFVYRFTQINIEKLRRRAFAHECSFADLKSGRKSKGLYLFKTHFCTTFRAKKNGLVQAATVLAPFCEQKISFDASAVSFVLKSVDNKAVKLTKQTIFAILGSKYSFYILQLLYNSLVIEQFFPHFKNIMFLPQFDGFHRYPADIHTLRCIDAVENISDKFVREIYEGYLAEQKAFIKLVLLYHDIGKGRGGSHHLLGAKMFVSYAKKIGLDEQMIEDGKHLILHHTLMSDTAQREDLDSERAVLSFAGLMREERLINLLYVITYADMNGVGEHYYSYMNAKLLKELYDKSLAKLSKTELLSEAAARLAAERQLVKSREFEELEKSVQKKLLSVNSALFFLRLEPAEMARLAVNAAKTEKYSFEMFNEDCFGFEIIAKQEINLGWLLGKLSRLDIVSMDIYKLFDRAKYFKVMFDQTVDEGELPLVASLIEESFDMSKKTQFIRPVFGKKEIEIDCEHSETYAKMKLNTKNQHGILAFVIEVFDELGVDIATAKVSTVRNMARDLFLIEKSNGMCEKKKEILKRLTAYAKSV